MAATAEATTSSMSKRALTVLCGDKELSSEMKEVHSKVEKPAYKEALARVESHASTVNIYSGRSFKKFSLYIGNFTWWTSDRDLVDLASTLGVNDIHDIKFAENGVNGQSRGYAKVVVSTEESLKILLRDIPTCRLNGENLKCCDSHGDLGAFQAMAEKRIPLRANSKGSIEFDVGNGVPTSTPQQPGPPIIPPCLPPPPLANKFPSPYTPFYNHPPPPLPYIMPNAPPSFPPYPLPVHMDHVTSQPPPNLHINPGFFNPAHDSHNRKEYSQQKHMDQPSNPALEELINKNRAITSKAITKAVSGATSGDLRLAIETLLTAITGIKQSTVYEDQRCQALVTSLKDCLVSIQANFGVRNSRRSQNRERDWDRDREREESHEWEAAGMSRRYRERSWSGERGGMRERDKHRDHRDRYR
ncbi:cleavage and polyadenylation specificity factor subunit 7-like isoform X2 [Lampris incognitus]|uniref:cleavage and polyadenylation specificity factor subunit 7-like isoform X2 n=1 Tax=Lampris incognitus TaxID=2546036 RepID=UPI0024B52050|nr:cleavage and polyadenylation specificity factor subunit 7-like isoform X2 [Lampris incognitus]